MNYIFTFILSGIILCVSPLWAEIRTLTQISNITQFTETTDANTWVIFDIDEVIIKPDDPLLLPHHKPFLKKRLKHLDAQKKQFLESIIWKTYRASLVDPKIIYLIQKLRTQNIKVLSHTNAWTGTTRAFPDMENARIQKLKDLGVDFSPSFSMLRPIKFTHLKGNTPHPSHPLFKDGILFGCDVPKGPMLIAFLEKANLTSPTQIIFVDDQLDNLKSLEKACQKRNIPFLGLHYTAVKDQQRNHPLDEKKAERQIEILITEERWVEQKDLLQDKRAIQA